MAIIGKPIDFTREEVDSLIEKYDLSDNVYFIGPAYNEEKFALMLQSDVFVFPTYYENECVPLVLIEAMQCGLPIITSAEGGIPSIVKDGYNGFLIDPKDVNDIANAIEVLILKPEKRNIMGKNGRLEYEANLTQEAFETKLTTVIKQVFKEIT